MSSRIATLFSIIVVGGMLTAATGCAVTPQGTETEKGAQAPESISPSAESEPTKGEGKVETESKVSPDTTCRPPLINCTCYYPGDGYESFCTTATICWHVCGG